MLKEIRLINYKAFQCERIELEPLTVFIGPNGSGKSSIASALHALFTIVRLGLSAAFPEGFFSFGYIQNFEPINCGYKFPPVGLGISGEISGMTVDYDIFFNRDYNSQTGYYISYEGIRIQNKEKTYHYVSGKLPEISFDLPTKGNENWPQEITQHPQKRDCIFVEFEKANIRTAFQQCLSNIKKYVQKMSKYQFQAAAARMQCDQYDGSGRTPILKSDGSNLAELAQFFQEEERGRFIEVKKWLTKYAKGGNKIIDIGVVSYEDKVFLNFFEEGQEKKSFEIRGPLLSDGYWIFSAFACLAFSPTLPSIAFFEEPESHLHPHKLPILIEFRPRKPIAHISSNYLILCNNTQ
jgi:predicted ATPase